MKFQEWPTVLAVVSLLLTMVLCKVLHASDEVILALVAAIGGLWTRAALHMDKPC